MNRALTSLCLLAGLLGAAPVLADEPKGALRLAAAWVGIDGSGAIDDIDENGLADEVSFDDAVGLVLEYEYRYGKLLGLQLGTLHCSPDYTVTSDGGQEIEGDSRTFTQPHLALNFHVFGGSRVDLYVGPHLAYTFFENLEDQFGYGAQVGADIGLTQGGLFLNLGARYTFTDAQDDDIGLDTGFDPLTLQVGIGLRW